MLCSGCSALHGVSSNWKKKSSESHFDIFFVTCFVLFFHWKGTILISCNNFMITCAMDKGPLIKFYNSGLDLLNWDELACCGKQAKTNRHIWTNHHKRHFALYWLGGMIYFICIYREEPLLSNVTNSDMLSYEYKQSLSLSHEIYRSISKPEDKNTLAYKKNACTWQAYFALIKYIDTQYCAYLSLQPSVYD